MIKLTASRLFFPIYLYLGSCVRYAHTSNLPTLQLPSAAPTQLLPAPSRSVPSHQNFHDARPLAVGIRDRPGAGRLSPQALANILIQSLYSVVSRTPETIVPHFSYSLSTSDRGFRRGYNATIDISSANLSAPYQLDNGRLALALSYLGGLFDQVYDMDGLDEFDFVLVITDPLVPPRIGNRTFIAKGYVVQPSGLLDM